MKRFPIVAVLFALSATGSRANDVVDACAGRIKATPERVIEACTIALSAESPEARVYAWTFRGMAYLDKDEFKAAIADFDDAIAHGMTGAFVYWYRAIAHGASGDSDRALADLTRATELKPEVPAPYYARGFIYAQAGDPARAIENFTQVITLAPGYRDAYYARAIVYEQAGFDDRALADYSKMIELNPSDIAAYAERWLLNTKLGNQEAASRDAYAVNHLASYTETPSPPPKSIPNDTDEVYVLDCMLKDGSSVPGYVHAREKRKPADFNYSLLQRDPKTGYCKDNVAEQHRRKVLADNEALERKRALENEEARRVGTSVASTSRPSAARQGAYLLQEEMNDERPNPNPNPNLKNTFDTFDTIEDIIHPPKFPTYTSQLKAPAYVPHAPSGVATHMDEETYRRTTPRAPGSINDMNTRYNPYETTSEALHGRGKRYDPYATSNSWAYDRANPYAVAPHYKYGIVNPLSPSGTLYNPSTTLGGGPQPNNWQTNRYDPFGTRRNSTPMSGLNQVPLTPLNPPSNCPRQPSSILNSHAKQC